MSHHAAGIFYNTYKMVLYEKYKTPAQPFEIIGFNTHAKHYTYCKTCIDMQQYMSNFLF